MSMDDLLKELQQEYIASIPDKINEIKSFLDKKEYNMLINSFHKLKGSGKTYGVNEITILGQFFEDKLKNETQKTLPLVPIAIDLLNKIYNARVNNISYKFEDDEQFKKLENLK